MCTVFLPMSFTVLLCVLMTALAPCCSTHPSRESRYECGPHGKFEYCIDEVPGCVVGCHCHPGYYFDTDSKICESNAKLRQHFRQKYLTEPTPTHVTGYPTPTADAVGQFDDKAHEITKDTDDLSDWLYNQFFKTIESQVINNSNNTKSNSNENLQTRRSGGDRPAINKSKRKSRKSVRGRKKKKPMKGRGLRRKLLRITEDDSLFDSDSDYDDTESSSSSESDSSSESADIDDDKKKSTEGSDDRDHGHKKVIIFNRRPKPPLPSFIFLPSMDTPYYPPIGLPPPPLVPMYPMVPVPPMPPPMFPPFQGPPKCDDGSSKATDATDHTTTSADHTTTSADHTTTSVDHTTTTTESTTDATTESTTDSTTESSTDITPESNAETTTTTESGGENRRHRLRKHFKKPNLEKNIARASGRGKLKHGQQSKVIQKLWDKLVGTRRSNLSPTHTESLDEELQNSEDILNISEDYALNKLKDEDQEENHVSKLEDVDFKYLSELIHRVNQGKRRNRLPLPSHLNDEIKELQKLQSPQPIRRNLDYHTPVLQVRTQSTDDVYYSNLGRQIASIIRNTDSKLDNQSIIDSAHANRQVPFHSLLNENSYAPRSFWERSVRSPVPQKVPVPEYLDEARTLKHSNEKSLINLENEVEVIASTPPPLSLQDLENILSTMQKAHAQIQFKQPMTNTKQSNVSLNVNLLPKHVRSTRTYSRLFDAPEKVEFITENYHTLLPPRVFIEMHPAVVANASVFHEPERKYNIPYSDYWIYNPKPMQPKTIRRPVFGQTNKPNKGDHQIYNTNPMKHPFAGVVPAKHTDTKTHGVHSQFLKSMLLTKSTTPKTREPNVVKHKRLNYFSGNKHYMFETDSYPILASFKTHVSNKIRKPSYFHQQLHQYQYFD